MLKLQRFENVRAGSPAADLIANYLRASVEDKYSGRQRQLTLGQVQCNAGGTSALLRTVYIPINVSQESLEALERWAQHGQTTAQRATAAALEPYPSTDGWHIPIRATIR